MKTPSRTVSLILLATAALSALIVLRSFAQPTPTPTPTPVPLGTEQFVLRIKNEHPLKKQDTAGALEFARLVCNGTYEASKKNSITLRLKNPETGQKEKYQLPEDCGSLPTPTPSPKSGAELRIKTDKVVISAAAKSLENEELTAIAPHVTQQISVRNLADVTAVITLLEQ